MLTKRTCQKSIAYLQYMYEYNLIIDELVLSSMNHMYSIFVNSLFLSSKLYSIKKKKKTTRCHIKCVLQKDGKYTTLQSGVKAGNVEETVNCKFYLHGFKRSIERPGVIYFDDACLILNPNP